MEINQLDIKASHIIFISDIHFGRHVNSEEWQDNMRQYFINFFVPKIREIKRSLLPDEKLICINLGDTYQDRKAIDINVNNLAIDMMDEIAKEVEVYILNGNHDLAKKTNDGNNSIRSFEYRPNITLITDPTLISINYEGGKHTKMIAIPYLGSTDLESQYLSTYSSKAKYALMHTELTNMKMDNGMLITSGANPEMFKGMIFSGHIHRRQEGKHVIYVGSPYHMDKGDIGNNKGIYVLNLKTNKYDFIENNYSPIYQTLTIEMYDEMDITTRQAYLNNNYTFIIIQEDDVPKYRKKYDIHNLGIGTTAKEVKVVPIKHKQNIAADENTDYKELSTIELINDSIAQLDTDDETKRRLIPLSNQYFKDAEESIAND